MNKLYQIVGSIKLYIQVGNLAKLVPIFVCEPLTVQEILECDFCDQFVEYMNPKTYSVKPVHGSSTFILSHYGEQQSASVANSKVV